MKPIKPEELKLHWINSKNRTKKSGCRDWLRVCSNRVLRKLVETLVCSTTLRALPKSFPCKNRANLLFFNLTTEFISYFLQRIKLKFMRTKGTITKFAMDYTLDELSSSWTLNIFFRANRQFILRYYLYWWNTYLVQWKGKLKVSISRSRKKVIVSRKRAGDFKSWLGRWNSIFRKKFKCDCWFFREQFSALWFEFICCQNLTLSRWTFLRKR